MRGLKYSLKFNGCYGWFVAPFAGAWIEIAFEKGDILAGDVAPFAGAWIEMQIDALRMLAPYGRTLRGCVD